MGGEMTVEEMQARIHAPLGPRTGASFARGQSKQDFQTPPEFLAAVKAKLGIAQFALDIAASHENAVCSPFLSEESNALAVPHWRDYLPVDGTGWGWLNPPFARIEPWVERAYATKQAGGRVAMLLPAGVGSNWWRDFVHGHAQVQLLNGRIRFVGAADGYPKDLVLLLYAPDYPAYYDIWTWQPEKTRGRKHARR